MYEIHNPVTAGIALSLVKTQRKCKASEVQKSVTHRTSAVVEALRMTSLTFFRLRRSVNSWE